MFPTKKPRSFSREFKLKVVKRMEAGENVAALGRELDIQRPLLYRWRNAFRTGGEAGFAQPTRPPCFA